MIDRFILEKQGHVIAPVAVRLHKAMIDAALEGALHSETEALVQTAMTRDKLEGARVLREARAEVHR